MLIIEGIHGHVVAVYDDGRATVRVLHGHAGQRKVTGPMDPYPHGVMPVEYEQWITERERWEHDNWHNEPGALTSPCTCVDGHFKQY